MAMVDTAVVETWTPTVQLAQKDDTQRVEGVSELLMYYRV